MELTDLNSKVIHSKKSLERIQEQSLKIAVRSKKDTNIKIKSSLDSKNTSEINLETVNWGDWDVNDIVDKFVKFSNAICAYPLYPYQEEPFRRIIQAFIKNEGCILTILCARQSGKTDLVAKAIQSIMILIPVLAKIFPDQLGMYKKGVHIGIFAPTNEQAYTVHSRIQSFMDTDLADEILADPDIDAKKKYPGGMVQILGPIVSTKGKINSHEYLSFCRIQTCAKQAKIESKSYHFIFIDESQEADNNKVTKSILPMTASTNGLMTMSGTPTTYTSFFYDKIQQNMQEDSVRRIKNHFQYDYRVCEKYNKYYRAHIVNMKKELGEDSDSFRMSYALEWLIEQGMAVTPLQFDEYLKDVGKKLEYLPQPDATYIAGLDLARKKDFTVLTIFKLINTGTLNENGDPIFFKIICNWLEMKGDDWEIIFPAVVERLKTFRIKIIGVDSTGVGDPIVSRLKRVMDRHDIEIVQFDYSPKTKEEMATNFYEEMRKGLIKVPYHSTIRGLKTVKAFMRELFSCEKKHVNNYMQICHPKNPSGKEKAGFHDDYFNSMMLGLIAYKAHKLPIIQSSPTNLFYGSTKGVSNKSLYALGMEKLKYRVAQISNSSISEES